MHKKILFANDGSDGARKAFDCAVEMASCFQAELHMISVEEHLPRHAQKVSEVIGTKACEDTNFEQFAIHCKQRAALRGVYLEWTIRPGKKVETIGSLAREGQSDLLIIGFMGRGGAFGRIWGGTSENLTKTAPCPVLVVK
jgi:nucleotide-binding universal stress UspA family protein